MFFVTGFLILGWWYWKPWSVIYCISISVSLFLCYCIFVWLFYCFFFFFTFVCSFFVLKIRIFLSIKNLFEIMKNMLIWYRKLFINNLNSISIIGYFFVLFFSVKFCDYFTWHELTCEMIWNDMIWFNFSFFLSFSLKSDKHH